MLGALRMLDRTEIFQEAIVLCYIARVFRYDESLLSFASTKLELRWKCRIVRFGSEGAAKRRGSLLAKGSAGLLGAVGSIGHYFIIYILTIRRIDIIRLLGLFSSALG